MSRTRVLVILTALSLGAAVAIGLSTGSDSGTVTADPATVTPAVVEPAEAEPAPATGPFTENGTLLVPTEIVPGVYKATATDGALDGLPYYEICGTLGCDAFGTGTILANGILDGPTYITIPAEAASVTLTDVTLTSVAGY